MVNRSKCPWSGSLVACKGLTSALCGMTSHFKRIQFYENEKDSTILSGIILSFLHLRHLDLRQIQHECFKHINYLVSINRNCSKMIEVFQKDSKIGDLGWFLKYGSKGLGYVR